MKYQPSTAIKKRGKQLSVFVTSHFLSGDGPAAPLTDVAVGRPWATGTSSKLGGIR